MQTQAGRVTLRRQDGDTVTFDPARMPKNLKHDAVSVYQEKTIDLHAGDRIRWTQNDNERGISNSTIGVITRLSKRGIEVTELDGTKRQLGIDDPMREKLDLAYAVNVHVAQGMTSKDGILVMSEQEKTLASSRAFLVAATRISDQATLIVDNAAGLQRAVERNAGERTAALDTIGSATGNRSVEGKSGRSLHREPERIDLVAELKRFRNPDLAAPPEPRQDMEREIERSR